jgi:phospholipase/carboxylesterase
MTNSPLEYIESETSSPPQRSVIWLHGLGADGQDFSDLPGMLDLPSQLAVRFLFPHAPMRPITLNSGMVMRGWYDVAGLGANRKEDLDGLEESSEMVTALIHQEMARGIATDQILLGGFSQGGALSLYLGLRYPMRLAGIVSLSAYLPAANRIRTERNGANGNTRVFLGHGLYDPMISAQAGDVSRQLLEELGYPVTWRTYPIEHSICDSEMRDLADFFVRCFSDLDGVHNYG